MSDITVFRTAYLHEHQLVLDALKRANIPAYARAETSSGVESAMPAGAGQGLGVFFIVKAPEPAAADARALIKTLPVAHGDDPGIHDFNRAQKDVWRELSRVALVALALVALLQTLFFITTAFRR